MLFQFPNSITSDNEMNADSQLEPFLTVLIISKREKKSRSEHNVVGMRLLALQIFLNCHLIN